MAPAETSSRLRRVTGRQNAVLKQLRRAFHQGETVEGCFAIEGLKLVEEALRSGMKFQAVVFSDSGAQRAHRLLPQIRAKVDVIVTSDDIFQSVVETESPQGVAALVHVKEYSLDAVLAATSGFWAVAAGVQDPGNLGTILRSAEGFGAGGVLLTEGTVNRFNPKVTRASAGSAFRLPAVEVKLQQAIAELRGRRITLIGTTSHKGTPLPAATLSGDLAFVIGNEGTGLPNPVLTQMDLLISIPHSEKVESLNAGVAASLLFYEAARQRAGGS